MGRYGLDSFDDSISLDPATINANAVNGPVEPADGSVVGRPTSGAATATSQAIKLVSAGPAHKRLKLDEAVYSGATRNNVGSLVIRPNSEGNFVIQVDAPVPPPYIYVNGKRYRREDEEVENEVGLTEPAALTEDYFNSPPTEESKYYTAADFLNETSDGSPADAIHGAGRPTNFSLLVASLSTETLKIGEPLMTSTPKRKTSFVSEIQPRLDFDTMLDSHMPQTDVDN
ncbi:unnamed protein product [Caenorhabditis auriculariae]|uniref:Uncharacterized protein n=1 Tax=Caenorhabditis auriculariae TaxID=2777116 RepID=A0A8S1H099_9PELO|nr:unnamed protein product [Caenorhabditis auriculariae]